MIAARFRPGPWSGAALSMVLRAVSMVASLWSIQLSIRLLGAEQYGLLALLQVASGWLVLGTLGVNETLTQKLVHHDPNEQSTLVRLGLAISSMGGLIALVVSAGACGVLFAVGRIPLAAMVAGTLIMAATALSNPLTINSSLLVSRGQISRDGFFKLIQPVLYLLLLLSIEKLHLGDDSLPAVGLAIAVSVAVPRILAFRNTVDFRAIRQAAAPAHSNRREFISACIPFFVIQVAALLAFQTDRFMVVNVAGLKDLAAYDVASRLYTALYTLAAVPLQYLWIRVGSAFRDRNVSEYTRTIASFTGLAIGFWSMLILAFVLFSAPVFAYLFRDDHQSVSASLIVLLGVFFLIRLVTDVFTISLYSIGEQKKTLGFVILHGITNVLFGYVGGMQAGIEGVVVGQVVSFVFSTLIPFAVIAWRSRPIAVPA